MGRFARHAVALVLGVCAGGTCSAQVAPFTPLVAANDQLPNGEFFGDLLQLVHTNSAGAALVSGQRRASSGGPLLAGRVLVRIDPADTSGARQKAIVVASLTPMPSVSTVATIEPLLDPPGNLAMLEDAGQGEAAAVRFRGRLVNVPVGTTDALARARTSGLEPTLQLRGGSLMPAPLDTFPAAGSTMRHALGAIALDGQGMGDGSSNRGWLMLAQVAPPAGTSSNDLTLFAFEGADRAGSRLVAQEFSSITNEPVVETIWSSNGLGDGVHYRDGWGRVVVCGRGLTYPALSNADLITRWTRGATPAQDRSDILLRTGTGTVPAGTAVSALGWRGLSVNRAGQIAFVGRDPSDAVYVLTDDAPLGQPPTPQTPVRLTRVLGLASSIENLPMPITSAVLAGPPAISNAPTQARGDFPQSFEAGYIASRVFLSNVNDNSFDTAITISYRASDGSWRSRAVIREGQMVPGLPASVVVDDLRGVFSNSQSRGLVVNVLGQVLVIVPLRGLGVVNDNNSALLAFDPEAGVQLLHREGTRVALGPGADLATSVAAFSSGGVNVAGHDGNLTDTGECIFTLSQPGVRSAIVSMQLPVVPVCDSIDFDNDGLFPEDEDLLDLLAVLAGGQCERERWGLGLCNDIDINNDGLFPSDEDLVGYLRLLAGGNCR